FGERLDVTVKLLFGNDLRDEADALCFDAGEIPSGERDVEGFLDRNSTVKKAGCRRGSVAPADDLRHAELCCVGSDHEIMTVDHGDAQSVFLLRPVDRQPRDAFVVIDIVDDEFIVGHDRVSYVEWFKKFNRFKSFNVQNARKCIASFGGAAEESDRERSFTSFRM